MLTALAHAQDPQLRFQTGGIYKWTDSEGSVHYTQSPPLGVTYERVSTARAIAEGAELEPDAEDAASESQGEGAVEEEVSEEHKQLVENRRFVSNCAIAQKNLEMLNDPARRFNTVGEDGLPVDAEEWRARQVEITQENIRLYCE